jgi:hypothetical protein
VLNRIHNKDGIIKEPCEVKISRTVLKERLGWQRPNRLQLYPTPNQQHSARQVVWLCQGSRERRIRFV